MIEQVIIDNYKSIRHTAIPMGSINVLIGANGAGKSNFISFMELSQNLLYQNLGNYILSNGGIDRFLFQGRKHSEYIDGLIDFNNKNAFFFRLKPAVGEKAFIEYVGDYFNCRNDKTKNYDGNWDKAIHDNAVEESGILDKTFRVGSIKNFVSGFTVYHFHDTSITSRMRSMCNINDNATLKHDGANLAAYLYMLNNQAPKEFRLIEDVVRRIAPYFKRFSLKPARNGNNSIGLEWEDRSSDMYLDGFSFSDGTIRFIALATLLLQPNPPQTILIDEPELGLHPSAINILAAMIRKASHKSQVIIATQSVNLVNNFAPEDIVVVEHKNEETTFSKLNAAELQNWLEDYSIGEIWEKNVIGGQP